MQISDALRNAIAQRGMTQALLAKKLDVSQPAVASVISVGNPQSRILLRFLEALDFRLVAVPAEAELPEGSIVLEPTVK